MILKNIHKNYKIKKREEIQVLKDINLKFNYGEITAILGDSGCGKSTLMNILAGFDTKYTGELFVDNILLSKEKDLDIYRRTKIGFIFQNFNLIKNLNVLENITLPLRLLNLSKKESNIRAINLLKSVGLKNKVYNKINELSGGEKQRVGIARALVNNPDIILADEPTGSLDERNAIEIFKTLRNLSKEGKMVIIVTHSKLVSELSDRIILIEDGMIKKDIKNRETLLYNPNEKEHKKTNIKSVFAIALNNIKNKIKRNIFISFAASIGIMTLVLMLSLSDGIESILNNSIESNNSLTLEVFSKDNIIDIENMYFIKEKHNIEKGYYNRNIMNNIKVDDRDYKLDIVKTLYNNFDINQIKEGNLPLEGEVIISSYLYNVINKSLMGEYIELSFIDDYKEILGGYRVSGIYESNMSEVVINYNDSMKYNLLYITFDNNESLDISKKLIIKNGYYTSIYDQIIKEASDVMDIFKYVLTAIFSISLVVSSLMILITLYIEVIERTREIGIIRSLGARKKDIRHIFMVESIIVGFISGILAIIQSFMIQLLVNKYTNEMYNVNIANMKLEYIVFGILLSIFISVLSGTIPSIKAARLNLIESLRYE